MKVKLQLRKDAKGSLVNSTQYRRVIRSLTYLTHTRPNLSYAIGIVGRDMKKPIMVHHQVVKHIRTIWFYR